jgi:hypothetical protein
MGRVSIFRYFDYIKNMTFKSNPDYKYLRSLFSKMAAANNFLERNQTGNMLHEYELCG